MALTESDLQTDLERGTYRYYDNKRDDALNLRLGEVDGYYHHHFAVHDFNHSVLDLTGDERENAVNAEMHRMETRQVETIRAALGDVSPRARVLDAGSGRGGTSIMLHQAFGCRVDGVNISGYQNDFARRQAAHWRCDHSVRFHDARMTATGFPDAAFDHIVSNETTMYAELGEAFGEFARVLKPGGSYVLATWCVNDAIDRHPPEEDAINRHYHCKMHSCGDYLRALLDAGIIPRRMEDLTRAAIPYWELRSRSRLATGIEKPYLEGHRSGRILYLLVAGRRAAAPKDIL